MWPSALRNARRLLWLQKCGGAPRRLRREWPRPPSINRTDEGLDEVMRKMRESGMGNFEVRRLG